MKQNVVLIVTDQQQAQALGCVNSSYKTPNLDKLAARGVRFSHN
ncbi:MAG: sulfatase-like hydrolase/transferase, partial [Sulfobacillus sp.]